MILTPTRSNDLQVVSDTLNTLIHVASRIDWISTVHPTITDVSFNGCKDNYFFVFVDETLQVRHWLLRDTCHPT